MEMLDCIIFFLITYVQNNDFLNYVDEKMLDYNVHKHKVFLVWLQHSFCIFILQSYVSFNCFKGLNIELMNIYINIKIYIALI